MKLTLLSAEDLRQALPMREAIEAMKEAFAALSAGEGVMPQRLAMTLPDRKGEPLGTTLVKPASLGPEGLGAKLVSVFPGNRVRGLPVTGGLMVMLDPYTGLPEAICDGTFLTAWRTAAATGAATDLLARRDVHTAALFGCGAQARFQVLAIDAVRELREIRVYARTHVDVQRFLREVGPHVKARLVAARSADEAVTDAELICTATTSSTPVFNGDRVAAGAHINGIGSFTPEMQEVDSRTVGKSRVFVDSKESAQTEAGDLIEALQVGRTSIEEWTELGDVVRGEHPGRANTEEITFFKSVGVAVQDVKAAAVALRRARKIGLGVVIKL